MTTRSGELKGQVAIVTGAASGIGRAIAEAFARLGARVALSDLNEAAAAQAAADIRKTGGDALGLRADVSKAEEVRAMVERVRGELGDIDILVNNAGLQRVAPIVDLDEVTWNLVIAVHLTGTFLCTKAVLPQMIERRRGRIINISSVHGKLASKFKAPYVAAKHGVIGFTRVLALEAAEHGITANAICPGYVRTPLVEEQLPRLAEEHGMSRAAVLEKVVLKDVPQKRLLEPEEVAGLACYLAGPAAAGITGQAINVSAGWCMH